MIEFDEMQFDPMKICAVKHDLVNHPLLQLPSLVALAERMAEKYIRFHKGDVKPSTSFEKAPQENGLDMPPVQVIRDIEEAGAWLSLHHIQQDPEYRKLVLEVLDGVRDRVCRKDSWMHNFAGWIFVSAPGAVTPYHMDHENNFILQIRGEKEIHVFNPLVRSVVTERCLEIFHRTWSRELVTYEDAHEQHATVFHVRPGDGAYMPTTAPHWVKNGDNVSVTVSFTYYSKEARRREGLHQFNWILRRLRMVPSPVGASPSRDRVKSTISRPLLWAERHLRGWETGRGQFAPVGDSQ